MRRKSKAITQVLQKECDTLTQQLGKVLYKVCEVCGKPMSCLHHLHPKSVSNALRYDFDNLVPICNGCHMRHHQAGDPTIHGTILKKRGQAWYDKLLKRRYQEMVKLDKAYYLAVKVRLEKELESVLK